ncbi:hypothetical protein AYI70_g5437 [Smittium culicis]|uniref:Uncharacterized protein n=1 Tax=Smittium culicis TaxID=133412 RepID=A0A1R1XUE5_9FUNG|nr:hypothetical protein AYI70_g5437 [Smittium culicis]
MITDYNSKESGTLGSVIPIERKYEIKNKSEGTIKINSADDKLHKNGEVFYNKENAVSCRCGQCSILSENRKNIWNDEYHLQTSSVNIEQGHTQNAHLGSNCATIYLDSNNCINLDKSKFKATKTSKVEYYVNGLLPNSYLKNINDEDASVISTRYNLDYKEYTKAEIMVEDMNTIDPTHNESHNKQKIFYSDLAIENSGIRYYRASTEASSAINYLEAKNNSYYDYYLQNNAINKGSAIKGIDNSNVYFKKRGNDLYSNELTSATKFLEIRNEKQVNTRSSELKEVGKSFDLNKTKTATVTESLEKTKTVTVSNGKIRKITKTNNVTKTKTVDGSNSKNRDVVVVVETVSVTKTETSVEKTATIVTPSEVSDETELIASIMINLATEDGNNLNTIADNSNQTLSTTSKVTMTVAATVTRVIKSTITVSSKNSISIDGMTTTEVINNEASTVTTTISETDIKTTTVSNTISETETVTVTENSTVIQSSVISITDTLTIIQSETNEITKIETSTLLVTKTLDSPENLSTITITETQSLSSEVSTVTVTTTDEARSSIPVEIQTLEISVLFSTTTTETVTAHQQTSTVSFFSTIFSNGASSDTIAKTQTITSLIPITITSTITELSIVTSISAIASDVASIESFAELNIPEEMLSLVGFEPLAENILIEGNGFEPLSRTENGGEGLLNGGTNEFVEDFLADNTNTFFVDSIARVIDDHSEKNIMVIENSKTDIDNKDRKPGIGDFVNDNLCRENSCNTEIGIINDGNFGILNSTEIFTLSSISNGSDGGIYFNNDKTINKAKVSMIDTSSTASDESSLDSEFSSYNSGSEIAKIKRHLNYISNDIPKEKTDGYNENIKIFNSLKNDRYESGSLRSTNNIYNSKNKSTENVVLNNMNHYSIDAINSRNSINEIPNSSRVKFKICGTASYIIGNHAAVISDNTQKIINNRVIISRNGYKYGHIRVPVKIKISGVDSDNS